MVCQLFFLQNIDCSNLSGSPSSFGCFGSLHFPPLATTATPGCLALATPSLSHRMSLRGGRRSPFSPGLAAAGGRGVLVRAGTGRAPLRAAAAPAASSAPRAMAVDGVARRIRGMMRRHSRAQSFSQLEPDTLERRQG